MATHGDFGEDLAFSSAMETGIAIIAGFLAGGLVRLLFPYRKMVSIVSKDIISIAVGSIVAAVVFTMVATHPNSAPIWITAGVMLLAAGVLTIIFKVVQRIFSRQTR